MRRSLKIHHSKAGGLPRMERILYSELVLDAEILSATRFLLTPDSYLLVELFSTSKSMFSSDYFNVTDIHSIYRDGRVFFNSSPVPWESDAEISWAEYRASLVEYLGGVLSQKLRHVSGMDEYYTFCMKYNLLRSTATRYSGKHRKLLAEHRVLERAAQCTGDADREILNAFSSYQEPELRTRFLLEVLDAASLLAISRMAGSVGGLSRPQRVYLHHRLCGRFLSAGRHRMAFLHAFNACRLLKQGANLAFEESLKLDAAGYVRERGWAAVLRNAMKRLDKADSMVFGVNPYRLRTVDKHAFRFRAASLLPTDITKCSGDSVLFNGKNEGMYFTDRLALRVLFSEIDSAHLQGVSATILATGERIFIPVHRRLDRSSTVSLFLDLGRAAWDEAEICLDALVFSNIVETISLNATWIRRKSFLSVKKLEAPEYIEKRTTVSFAFELSSDGFASRVVGQDVVRNNDSVQVSFKISETTSSACILRHEIAPDVFERLEFPYSVLKT